jgi:hypothetical protein
MSGNAFFMVLLAVFLGVHIFGSRGQDAEQGNVAGTAAISNEERKMLNWKIVSWSLGAWAAVSFVVCVIWGLLTPEALHMHAFLEQILPAFKWLTWWSIPLGLVESFLLGFYAGVVYVPIHNFFTKRWGSVA